MSENKEKVLELLRCAEINAGNIKKVGPVLSDVVIDQIRDAIKILEEE